jgi:hypothetical protein
MKRLIILCLFIIFWFGTSFSADNPLTFYTFEQTSKVLENEIFVEVRQFIDSTTFFEGMSKDTGNEICTNIGDILRRYDKQSKVIMYRDPKVILYGVNDGTKKAPTFVVLNLGFILYDPVYKESYSIDIVRLFKIKLQKVNKT